MRTTQKQGLTFPHSCPFNDEHIITGRDDFRTDLDYQEYLISGLCQRCIDEFFDESEEIR